MELAVPGRDELCSRDGLAGAVRIGVLRPVVFGDDFLTHDELS